MKQPDEPWIDQGDEDADDRGVWLWVTTILASLGIVGLVMLYAFNQPLGFEPVRTMTER